MSMPDLPFALGILDAFDERQASIGAGISHKPLPDTKVVLDASYRWAEISWVLETNVMMCRTAEMLGAKVYRTYRVYEKQLQDTTHPC